MKEMRFFEKSLPNKKREDAFKAPNGVEIQNMIMESINNKDK